MRHAFLRTTAASISGLFIFGAQARASNTWASRFLFEATAKGDTDKVTDIRNKPVNRAIAALAFAPEEKRGDKPMAFPILYAITPERRAFLNLIRYLAGTWNAGDDSGYAPPREANSSIIGAYGIYKKIYFEAGQEIGIFPKYDNAYLRPEIQDQIMMHLIKKYDILPAVDRLNEYGNQLPNLVGLLQPVVSISFSRNDDKNSETPSHEELAKFWRSNLNHLVVISQKPPASKSLPWPDLILEDLAKSGIITKTRRDQIISGFPNDSQSPSSRPSSLPPIQQPSNQPSSNGLLSNTEREPLRFDQSLDELVRQGAISPSEHQRIRQYSRVNNKELNPLAGQPANALQKTVSEATTKTLSARELALLRQMRSRTAPSWRKYGTCKYDWSNWKRLSGDIRSTTVECGESGSWVVGVSCIRLLTNIYLEQSGWQGWERPATPNHKTRSGEDEMVAALCANLVHEY
jgi:hypothetical protein